jgi:hypothetical protein
MEGICQQVVQLIPSIPEVQRVAVVESSDQLVGVDVAEAHRVLERGVARLERSERLGGVVHQLAPRSAPQRHCLQDGLLLLFGQALHHLEQCVVSVGEGGWLAVVVQLPERSGRT